MKKVLSVLLAVSLILSMVCVNVFATSLTGKQHVVGTQGEGTDPKPITNGKDTIGALTNNQTDVVVNFNDNGGTGDSIIENRYAVDVTYYELKIDLTAVLTAVAGNDYKYVWDVNDYKYVLTKSDDTVVESEDNTPYEIDAFQLTNHSDMPINYGIAFSNETYPNDMTLAIIDGEGNVFTNGSVVAATKTVYDETNGEVQTQGSAAIGTLHKLRATPAQTWVKTVNNLIDQGAETNDVIGTVTITVTAGS